MMETLIDYTSAKSDLDDAFKYEVCIKGTLTNTEEYLKLMEYALNSFVRKKPIFSDYAPLMCANAMLKGAMKSLSKANAKLEELTKATDSLSDNVEFYEGYSERQEEQIEKRTENEGSAAKAFETPDVSDKKEDKLSRGRKWSITKKQLQRLCNLRESGHSYREIAEIANLSYPTVYFTLNACYKNEDLNVRIKESMKEIGYIPTRKPRRKRFDMLV